MPRPIEYFRRDHARRDEKIAHKEVFLERVRESIRYKNSPGGLAEQRSSKSVKAIYQVSDDPGNLAAPRPNNKYHLTNFFIRDLE